MFDFTSVMKQPAKLSELTTHLTVDDLRRFTDELIDRMLELIANCDDADVVFQPIDQQANDKYAATDAEVNLPWILGHVIVHVTASAEEAAFLAAELARGVTYHGRSRYEVPWETVTTITQCRNRLEESRRMRLASLEVWPDTPHLDNTYEIPGDPLKTGPINAVMRFVLGLRHDQAHLDQIQNIVQQSKAARS
jgi:hypothetical protein